MSEDMNIRFMRQLDIIAPMEMIRPIHVFGLGTIGSWSALTIAKMGCTHLTLYDMDTITEHNIPNQFYGRRDIERRKTDSLINNIGRFVPHLTVFSPVYGDALTQRIDVKSDDIVVLAFDSLPARLGVWELIKNTKNVWVIDARMALEDFRIFTINTNNEADAKRYEQSLKPKQTLELPCGARSISYNGVTIGGFVTSLVKKILKGEPTPYEICFSLKNYQSVVDSDNTA